MILNRILGLSCLPAEEKIQPRSDQKPPTLDGRSCIAKKKKVTVSYCFLFSLFIIYYFLVLLAGITGTLSNGNIHSIPSVYHFIRSWDSSLSDLQGWPELRERADFIFPHFDYWAFFPFM